MNTRNLIILLTVSLAVYGWNFWGTPVYMLDEAKNAGCAAEMLRTGNYVVPVFNGEFHDKPVLQYYAMMACYSIGGVNGFTARLGSVLCGILMIGIFYSQATRFVNEQAAFLSSFILIASLQLSYQFKMAVPDPYLLVSLVAGLLFFFRGFTEQNKKYLWLFYVCVAFGFLAKGPIAVVLPGVAILFFLIFQRRLSLRELMTLQLLPGILLFLAVAAPWYIAVGIKTDWAWPEYFFITHNLSRYMSTFEGHRGFPGDTLVIVLSALLPLSVFAPQALKSAWKHRNENPFLVFSGSCCAAVIGFFLFSKTVLPSYPSPCIPFAAVLLGFYLDRILTGAEKLRGSIASTSVLLVICLAVPVAGYSALKNELPALRNYAFLFTILPAGALGFAFLVKTDRLKQAFIVVIASFIITQVMAFSFVLPAVYNTNPVRRGLSLLQNRKPSAYFATCNSAFIFELQTILPKLNDEKEVRTFAAMHPHAVIVTTLSDWQRLASPPGRIIFEGKDLFERPVTVLVELESRIQ